MINHNIYHGITRTRKQLERQLGEEPLVLAGLVLLLKSCLSLEYCSLPLARLFQCLLVHRVLVKVDLDGITSGKKVRVSHDLKRTSDSFDNHQNRTFTKGFSFILLACFFLPMSRVILRGYLSIPVIRACEYARSLDPSS